MKIAIISDMHLGYARFEEDSYVQAENAFLDADGKADIVVCAGDVFDTKIPKLETIKRAVEMLRRMKIPVYMIHGNHERRSRDLTNPVQILSASGAVSYLNGEGALFEKNGEKVYIFGFGSVPEDLASSKLKEALAGAELPPDAFKVLVIHQDISEIMPAGGKELSFADLKGLPFDLMINGHIHEKKNELDGKFLIPGSTVITQLKKEETSPRGYLMFDTSTKQSEFVEIRQRKFFFEEIKLEGAGISEVRAAVEKKIAELRAKDGEAVIKIKVRGSLREGITSSDIGALSFSGDGLLFIDNELDAVGIKERIERIKRVKEEKLSVREVALRMLEETLTGKVTLFRPHELFEKLCAGVDEAEGYVRPRLLDKD